MQLQTIIHTIPPLYDSESRVLLLGSIPSPKSREVGFFYGHPQNRFWRVLAAVLADKSRAGFTEQVKELLKKHGADKLSAVDPAEYKALLADAEVIGNAG